MPSLDIKHQLTSFSLPLSSVFPRKKELEALELLPPPPLSWEKFLFKKRRGGLRLQANKEPHGVWILAQTWGLRGRARSLGGSLSCPGLGFRIEEEICGGQGTRGLSRGNKKMFEMERRLTGRGWGSGEAMEGHP